VFGKILEKCKFIYMSKNIILLLNKKEEIKIKYKEQNFLAYYTCFFGNNSNVANVIRKPPSQYHDCYYFTNNKETYEKIKNSLWKPILLDIPIKNDLTEDAKDSKELKACPHFFDILNNYKYSCYIDSKINVNEGKIYDIIEEKLEHTNYLFVLRKHPFIKNNVWDEFNECLKQKRYQKEKQKYFNYINEQIKNGLKIKSNVHFTTNFILRKNNEITKKINETWFEHIKQCGIECQISFFFIYQMYKEFISEIDF
jgi:hypothetical protein